MTEQELLTELCNRYRIRLKSVYSQPNPYYDNPLYEYSEIKNWIIKLEKIINK